MTLEELIEVERIVTDYNDDCVIDIAICQAGLKITLYRDGAKFRHIVPLIELTETNLKPVKFLVARINVICERIRR